MMRPLVPAAGLALVISLAGCGSDPDEPVLATVAGDPITLSEFRSFAERIPDGMKEGETPYERDRQLLESLVDRELLLRAALDTGVESDPEVQDDLEQFERRYLRKLHYQEYIARRVTITPEEVEAHHRATGRDRALRLGAIMLHEAAAADSIHALLKAGADFKALAREHSVHEPTAPKGGDFGTYLVRDQMPPEAGKAAADLAVGAFTEPLRETLGREGRFHAIYMVLDEVPSPLSVSEAIVVEEVALRKRDERMLEYLDSLRSVYPVQVRGPTVRLVAERISEAGETDPDLSDPEVGEVIATYADHEVTVGGFFEMARRAKAKVGGADSLAIAQLLRDRILSELFIEAEIEAAGLREDAGLRKAVDLKRQELLVTALRRREVTSHVRASDEEARRFYDENPDQFTRPEYTAIVEIVVASDTMAMRLRRELEEGADAEALAAEHTLRPGAAHHDGRLNVSVFTQSFFPVLAEKVQEVEVGGVGGPFEVAMGHSVFKVLEREAYKDPYNEESERRARAYVRIGKANRGYTEYVRGLREEYPVQVFEDRLRRIEG
jgi:parvulin-like peptidyl-prolyl isomerase